MSIMLQHNFAVPSNQTEVLIVGGGPVGMTLALTLRRYDVPVIIVDKAATTRIHSQAAVLWQRTLEILDLLGIVDDWQGRTIPMHSVTIMLDGTATNLDLHSIPSPYPLPMLVGQDRTEALLDARLKSSGAVIRRETEAIDVKLDESGATTTLRTANGETEDIRSSWVIGCDGSASIVRSAAGLTRHGERNAGVQILQGDMCISSSLTLEPGRGYIWSGKEGVSLLVFPIDVEGHYRVLVTLADDGAQETPTLTDISQLAQRFLPNVKLYDPIWLSRYRTQHQNAERYRQGRALIAGDAAHVWVPVGGQGMNIGMHEAFDLGWKLAGVVRGELPERVLDTYETERRPIAERVVTETQREYGALLQPHSLTSMLRRSLIPFVLGFAPLSARFANHLAELDVRYPTGILVADHMHERGLNAGMHAPDAYVNHSGKTIRLFDLYRTGHWIILGWVMHADDHEVQDLLTGLDIDNVYLVDTTLEGVKSWSGKILRDIPKFAANAFSVKRSCIHVIRPDGIIGYRGSVDRSALKEYITSIGILK